MVNFRRVRKTNVSKRLLKKKISQELESMYVPNPGMTTDIDSYNFGIHDALEKIKKIL